MNQLTNVNTSAQTCHSLRDVRRTETPEELLALKLSKWSTLEDPISNAVYTRNNTSHCTAARPTLAIGYYQLLYCVRCGSVCTEQFERI